MMFFEGKAFVTKLKEVLGWTGGGVYKRIDENRELLELLLREVPEYMDKNPWVVGWLKCHDEFFVELEKLAELKEGRFLGQAKNPNGKFPRPFPAIETK